MRRVTIATALALTLSIAPTAHATPCKTSGSSGAHELTFDLKDPMILQGLEISFQLGLMPKEFPESDIAARKDPCTRGPFPFANGMTIELHGEDDDSPPRWAVPPIPGPTVYVALVPKPVPALKFMDAARHGGKASFHEDDMMFVIALTRGDAKRHIFHFFDKIPTDDRLKELLRPITISQGWEQVTFDTTQRKATIPQK